jgi:hypothetical protein
MGWEAIFGQERTLSWKFKSIETGPLDSWAKL